jgi:hypothetical protein
MIVSVFREISELTLSFSSKSARVTRFVFSCTNFINFDCDIETSGVKVKARNIQGLFTHRNPPSVQFLTCELSGNYKYSKNCHKTRIVFMKNFQVKL